MNATEKNICAREKHRRPWIKDLFTPWLIFIGKARNISPSKEKINAISKYIKYDELPPWVNCQDIHMDIKSKLVIVLNTIYKILRLEYFV